MSIGGMNGRIGGSGILAAPGREIGGRSALGPTMGGEKAGPSGGLAFRSQSFSTTHVAIWGVTRDDAGNIIPNCRVQLYRNQGNLHAIVGGPTDLIFIRLRAITPQPNAAQAYGSVGGSVSSIGELVEETRSDVNGNYIFWSPHVTGPFWLVAWQDFEPTGSFGWSGATDKTIQPEPLEVQPF